MAKDRTRGSRDASKWQRLHDAGMSAEEIAKTFGVETEAVVDAMREFNKIALPSTPTADAAARGPAGASPRRRGRRPIANAAMIENWKKSYQSGKTLAEIAQVAGVSVQTVSYALRKLGVTPGKRGRPPGRPGKKQPIENSKYARILPKWIESYQNGASVNQIAGKYKLHPYSVQYALSRAGVNLRGARRVRITEAMIREWTELYHKGMGSRAIARKYGVNETTVRRRLKRKGVPIRSNSLRHKP